MTVTRAVLGDPTAADPRQTGWDADELQRVVWPEPRWAVPGLLPEGCALLAGPPKIGKSWLGLGVAAAVASGGKALGRIDVAAGDVLCLALEDGGRRLSSRLSMMLGDEPWPPRLRIETDWPRMPDGGTVRLATWLAGHPAARLLVIDVLARVRGDTDSGGRLYDADYQTLAELTALAEHHGVAVLVVHHTRKAGADDWLDTVSGTHGLAGAADAVLVLRRSRGSADAILHVTGRDIAEAEHALRFDAARGLWTLLDGQAADYDLSDTRRLILDVLRDYEEPLGPTAVAQLTKLDVDLVKKTMQRMARDDQVRQSGRGRYLSPVPSVPLSPPEGTEGTQGTGDRHRARFGGDHVIATEDGDTPLGGGGDDGDGSDGYGEATS